MDVKTQIAKAAELLKSRSYGEAIPLLRDLLEHDGNNELALGMLASVYAEINMPAKAVELYERILAVNPANPLARFQLGMQYFNSAQIDKALEVWSPGLKDKNDFMLHYFSAVAYLQKNQPDKAQPLLEIAARNMPQDHPLYPSLAQMSGKQPSIH